MKPYTYRVVTVGAGVLLLAAGAATFWLDRSATGDAGTQRDMPSMKSVSDTDSERVTVQIPEARRQLIGVRTARVEQRHLRQTVRLPGRVDYDERRLSQVNLRVSGWIRSLTADFTGQFVQRGEPLLTLYSPDLVATQEEYLLSRRTLAQVSAGAMARIADSTREQVDAARERLRLWGVAPEQIAEIERTGRPLEDIPILAPASGVVTKRNATHGMYVTPETTLYEIADLAQVWVLAALYEPDLALVRTGQKAVFFTPAVPGERFEGKISYIDPRVSTETRSAKARIELGNAGIRLWPGLYGEVVIEVDRGRALAIPREAVLDSGTAKTVFIAQNDGRFEPRAVALGVAAGEYIPVLSGLAAGDSIVTSANFLIDSESRLAAATNQMGLVGMAGIRMEQAQMGRMETGIAAGPQERRSGGVTLRFETRPSPAKVGDNTGVVSLVDAQGRPLQAHVTVAYTMTMPGMMVESVAAKETGSGRYEAPVKLAMAGGWSITVTVERPGQPAIKEAFTVTAAQVKGDAMPGMPGM